MNTREAYAKYGRWAVIAGYAAYRRSEDAFDEGLKDSVRESIAAHCEWEAGGTVNAFGMDDDYAGEIIPFIVSHARLRAPDEH